MPAHLKIAQQTATLQSNAPLAGQIAQETLHKSNITMVAPTNLPADQLLLKSGGATPDLFLSSFSVRFRNGFRPFRKSDFENVFEINPFSAPIIIEIENPEN